MPTITINITEREQALLAHCHEDIAVHYTEEIQHHVDKYEKSLADRLVKRSLDLDTDEAVTLSRKKIVKSMFDAEDYLNAAERKQAIQASQDAGEYPLPNFNHVIV